MTAISRTKTKLWVVASDTAASDLVTTSPYSSTVTEGYITGEIKSYSKSGGDTDVESDPVFGGYVDKEKPQSQFELGFEIVPSLEKAHLWEEMVYGSDVLTGVLSAAASRPADRAVYIQAEKADGSFPEGWGFNNCNVTVLDMEHNADDNQTKNLTLKFSPTTENDVTNYIFNSYSRDTTFTGIEKLPRWDGLDNN